MKHKQFFILTGCAVFCVFTLFLLYAFSPLSKEMFRADFTRRFISPQILSRTSTMDLGVNSYYFAGVSNSAVYLGNATSPFHVLMSDLNLTDSQHVSIDLVGIDTVKNPRAFKLTVKSPYVYLAHGSIPEIFRGNVGQWTVKRFMPDSTDFFVEAVPISKSSFAMRSFSLKEEGYELAKKYSNGSFKFNFALLEKQIDGVFCVDGKLHYNDSLNRLVYLYNYRNEFIVADTNMNLIYRGHTIDPFSRAKIKVSQVKKGQESTLSAPPMLINGASQTSGKYLFIHSNLLSKNEVKEKFLNSSVLDIYNLLNGTYIGSFYIPNQNSERISDFVIQGDCLLTIKGEHLTSYKINLNFLK